MQSVCVEVVQYGISMRSPSLAGVCAVQLDGAVPVASVVDVVVAALLFAAQADPVHIASRPTAEPPADVNVPPTAISLPSERTTSPVPPVIPESSAVHVPLDSFATPAAGTEFTLVKDPAA